MMIHECVKRVSSESPHILKEALIVDKHIREIQEMTDRICDEISNFYQDKDEWNYEDEDFDNEYFENDDETPRYKNVGQLCGVDVIIIYDPNDDSGNLAAYNDRNNEIWVLLRGNETRNDIFESLTHELIHKFDNDNGKAYDRERFNPSLMNEDVWYIFRQVLYLLWNPSEFNARQSVVAFGDMSRTNWFIHFLEKRLAECYEVPEEDGAWGNLAEELSQYYGDKLLKWPRAKVRDFFLRRSYYLLDKFKRKAVRKTSHYSYLSENTVTTINDVRY